MEISDEKRKEIQIEVNNFMKRLKIPAHKKMSVEIQFLGLYALGMESAKEKIIETIKRS